MDGARKDSRLTTIRQVKEGPGLPPARLPVFQYGHNLAWLEPVTRHDLDRGEAVSLLAGWHQAGAEEARRWLEEILTAPDSLLFWVKGLDGTPVGHVGLGRVDHATGRAELVHLRRGRPRVLPGVMYAATQAVLAWAFQALGMSEVALQAAADDVRTRRLGERCGFREISRTDGRVRMAVSRSDWMTGHHADRAA